MIPTLIVAVMFAGRGTSTPIGYQPNAMVYAAADDRFSDCVKIGLPRNVVVGIATCAAIVWLMH